MPEGKKFLMKSLYPLLVFVLGVFLVCAAGCVQESESSHTPGEPTLATPSPAVQSGTEELVGFVDEALAYAREHGQEAALVEFNDPRGSFVRGDRYIFAYDFQGTVLALPFQPELLGTNRMDILDINGRPYIRDMAEVAATGSGFVQYMYTNPAKGYTYEPKLSYVAAVDENWWLGSGMYLSGANRTGAIGMAPMTKEQLKRFVESAVSFARQTDRKSAIAQFQNKTGPFVEGDLYIYALDYQGNVLALPFQPERVGTSMLDATDVTGQPFTRVEIDIARKGGGFVYYLYPNPGRNFTVEPKMSYVQNVDDTYWIGAGTYLPAANSTV